MRNGLLNRFPALDGSAPFAGGATMLVEVDDEGPMGAVGWSASGWRTLTETRGSVNPFGP